MDVNLYHLIYFVIFIILLNGLIEFGKLLYVYYIGHLLGKNPDLKSFGKWCVITGCTSGIGRGYAYAFAKRGIDLILISRDPEKLKSLATDLQQKYNIETKTITADFSKQSSIFDEIRKMLEGLDIGILVNNVGMLHRVERFCSIPNIQSEIENTLNTNLHSTLMMTSIILPKMVKKDKGLVLFLSSIAATMPINHMQMYGASKCFMDYFSKCLEIEHGSKNLIIQSILPATVLTNMVQGKESITSPTPETFVESHLKTIGLTNRTHGYFFHHLLSYFYRPVALIPNSMRIKMMDKAKKTTFSYQLKND